MENIELTIRKLCEKCKLGEVKSIPALVTGGLLHKMYHVVTDSGEYAVKMLNPDIMKRACALNNMIHSEEISNRLKDNISKLEYWDRQVISCSMVLIGKWY